jgi:pimeloyl-ACP methyl ester carboxylesterase
MPTLVLAGNQDPGMKAVQVTHEDIAHSQLVLLDAAGHFSKLDQPRRSKRQ